MKLWVDDIRPAPEGYVWCKDVLTTKYLIKVFEKIEDVNFLEYDAICETLLLSDVVGYEDYLLDDDVIEFIDLDHDAGDYRNQGGDYIKILDWLEQTGRNYPIRIHSMNPVGRENMRRIIKRNGWTEVL